MLVVALVESRLWPVSELRHMPLDKILELMESNQGGRLGEQESKLKACCCECRPNPLAEYSGILEVKLTNEARRIRLDVKGLCYRCIREGNLGAVECGHV